MLITSDNSCLLIIDVQEKLINAVQNPQQVVDNCAWLLQVAHIVGIPILVSEQYPKGLGATVPQLKPHIPADAIMEKLHFSCMSADNCKKNIEDTGCQQIIIAGIETHVCVLQTALELIDNGKDVFIVADAVSSRKTQDMELALLRMRDVGVNVVSKEMVLFEWIKQAGTPLFKKLSKQFLQ